MTHFHVSRLDRPIKDWSNWTRTEADEIAEKARIELRTAARDEWRRNWTPPEPWPPQDDEGEFKLSAIEWSAFEVHQLQQQGRAAAATAPVWMCSVDTWLDGFEDDGILSREPTAASITLPFLMRGGEFAVTYTTHKYRGLFGSDDDRIHTSLNSHKRLRVKSEHGIWYGDLISLGSEMNVELVSLPFRNVSPTAPSDAPQDAVNRVAAAYSAIAEVDLPADYPTVMPLRPKCTFCGRPFTDLVSKTIGLGPSCARRLRVPHSAEFANRILERRQAFLEKLVGNPHCQEMDV